MISLTWEQVHAWRLEQHCLAPRLERRDYLRAVERVLGIQAQVLSAAELSLGARVDALTRSDVQAALWQDRTLVRTWAMRGTLHLFASQDLPLIVAARRADGNRHRLNDFLQNGFTEAQYDELLLTVPQVLGEEPMTREALANAVAERMNAPQVSKALLTSSWGTLWKPSMYRGDLCFGPSEGQGSAKTFVNPRKWLHDWKERDPHEAMQEVARRYLSTYGPATPRDFSFWWNGGGKAFGKEAFDSLKGEVESVDVEGWQATALRSTIEAMERAAAEHAVRLLPMFDVYVLARSRNLEPVLAMEHKGMVFRPAAWVSAVALVDGRIKGVWEYETRKQQTAVKVRMFDAPSLKLRKELEGEAERIGSFLDTEVAVEFLDAP